MSQREMNFGTTIRNVPVEIDGGAAESGQFALGDNQRDGVFADILGSRVVDHDEAGIVASALRGTPIGSVSDDRA